MVIIKSFGEIQVDTMFRWPGGCTFFVKIGEGIAEVADKPGVECYPSAWESVAIDVEK